MPTKPSARDLRVDVLRFVALVSMFVAHCAPGDATSRFTQVSEYLTAALFATLVGVGLQLSWTGRHSVRSFVAGAAVRGAVLVALGAWVDNWLAQVVIVLAYLGLLTWVAAAFPGLPTAALAAGAVGCWLVSPFLQDRAQHWWIEQLTAGHHTRAWIVQLVAAGAFYRLVTLLVWALLGMILVRTLHHATDRRLLQVAAVTGACCAVLYAAYAAGVLPSLDPYDGRHASIAFNALLVVCVTALVRWLTVRLPRAVTERAAIVGRMTLTAYVLQIAWLAYYVRVLHPGRSDDSWANVALLTGGSTVLALAWHTLVRVQPWRRGPIEGPVDAVVAALR